MNKACAAIVLAMVVVLVMGYAAINVNRTLNDLTCNLKAKSSIVK